MTPLYDSRQAADSTADQLRVYAQPQRLMILSFLMTGEHTVGEIEDATGVTQPALSQQLAELRRAELVTARREAKKVYYRLASDWVRQCVQNIEVMAGAGAGAGEGLVRVLTVLPPSPALPVRPKPNRPSGAASFAIVD